MSKKKKQNTLDNSPSDASTKITKESYITDSIPLIPLTGYSLNTDELIGTTTLFPFLLLCNKKGLYSSQNKPDEFQSRDEHWHCYAGFDVCEDAILMADMYKSKLDFLILNNTNGRIYTMNKKEN